MVGGRQAGGFRLHCSMSAQRGRAWPHPSIAANEKAEAHLARQGQPPCVHVQRSSACLGTGAASKGGFWGGGLGVGEQPAGLACRGVAGLAGASGQRKEIVVGGQSELVPRLCRWAAGTGRAGLFDSGRCAI